MTRMFSWIVSLALAVAIGVLLGSRFQLSGGGATAPGSTGSGEPEILYWVAPMDPNFRRDGPGKSPMGMDLVPVYAGEGDSDGVTVPPEVVRSMGVKTELVERGPLWRRIEATGHVGPDEGLSSHVHVRTDGWIERLAVKAEGDPVLRGDVLFEIYSPELVNAQKEYLQVRGRGQQALIDAAAERLRSLGMTPGQIAELGRRNAPIEALPILAPQDGVVAALNVRPNMYVRPADVVLSIIDLRRVWVHARVFEAQADWVAVGQSAEVRMPYLPGELLEGRVDYIYPTLDPKTRTLRVRLVFENSSGRLKPNMFSNVVIYGGARRDVLSIPRDALIRSGDFDRVVVSLGDGRFEVREVLAGIESGDWVEVRRGLDAGDEVVTSAQFLIDSEAGLSGSIRRLGGSGSARTEPVFGAGTIHVVDPEAGTVDLSHDPIEALGWPAMRMDLPVTDNVDLSRVPDGASVHFSLVEGADGSYRINMIHVMEAPQDGADEPGSMEPAMHDGHD